MFAAVIKRRLDLSAFSRWFRGELVAPMPHSWLRSMLQAAGRTTPSWLKGPVRAKSRRWSACRHRASRSPQSEGRSLVDKRKGVPQPRLSKQKGAE